MLVIKRSKVNTLFASNDVFVVTKYVAFLKLVAYTTWRVYATDLVSKGDFVK